MADTRTALRLRLARDLHDFVAHDIGEMVAHAQAGTVAGDPRQALERVEAAGQRALSVLDRTLDMLHHDRPLGPVGDLGGISEAAARFSAAGPTRVDLHLDPAVSVPVETAALAYRIVIEGLTDVRRHAPRATHVDLRVTASAGVLEITMTNDGVTGPRRRRRGGSGLPGLAALVAEQGCELITGEDRRRTLPLAGHGEEPRRVRPAEDRHQEPGRRRRVGLGHREGQALTAGYPSPSSFRACSRNASVRGWVAVRGPTIRTVTGSASVIGT